MSTSRFVPTRAGDQKVLLQAARAHYNGLRFGESYHLLRRFFDRLPFQPEPEHGEYMGMFARVLSELGKNSELKFYLPVLENWWAVHRDPAMGYALAVLYRNLPEPRPEPMRKVLEEILAGDDANGYQARAKMLLAYYYDWVKDDLASCRMIIANMEEPIDQSTRTLWQIWRAKILRDQSKLDEAQIELDKVFAAVNMETDWYGFFSAQVIQAGILAARDDRIGALAVVAEMRRLFSDKNLKTVNILIERMEANVNKPPDPPSTRFRQEARRSTLTLGRNCVVFKRDTPVERVFFLLARQGGATKKTLLETALCRPYAGSQDDKLVYHYVHSLREKFRQLGLAGDVLKLDGEDYRLLATVHLESDEDL